MRTIRTGHIHRRCCNRTLDFVIVKNFDCLTGENTVIGLSLNNDHHANRKIGLSRIRIAVDDELARIGVKYIAINEYAAEVGYLAHCNSGAADSGGCVGAATAATAAVQHKAAG